MNTIFLTAVQVTAAKFCFCRWKIPTSVRVRVVQKINLIFVPKNVLLEIWSNIKIEEKFLLGSKKKIYSAFNTFCTKRKLLQFSVLVFSILCSYDSVFQLSVLSFLKIYIEILLSATVCLVNFNKTVSTYNLNNIPEYWAIRERNRYNVPWVAIFASSNFSFSIH